MSFSLNLRSLNPRNLPKIHSRSAATSLLTASLLTASLLVASLLIASLPTGTAQAASPEAIYGENAMIASRSTLASAAGIEIMKNGGNAVDGAVATAFALAVTWPSAGNIGGGGFAVVRLENGKVITLDFREIAPAAAHRDMYLDEDGNDIPELSRASHLASGVPGSVDGLLALLNSFGTKSRKEVMAPAIRLARKGFPLTWTMARAFDRQQENMGKYPASVAKFTNNGKPYKPGDLWVQKDLADTLKRISSKGRAGFYQGKTADLIVAEMQRGGGIITHEDLKGYRSVWREPIRGIYREFEIYGMPPPSSGGVMIQQMLNMLEPFDIKAKGFGSAELVHLMVEAERRAFADRAVHLGDPDFVDVPSKMLIDPEYARERFADFNPRKATDSNAIGAGSWPPEGMETTHFSVMDKSGMMVAITTTLNSSYGSKIVVTGGGFLLNNEMDDFSAKPNTANQFQLLGSEANAIAPGKRMLSSMTPTLVLKGGEPFLITGSPGGATIITTTLQVILNVLDHEMSLEDAVSLPRFHHQWKPNLIFTEPWVFSPDTREQLKRKGHSFRPTSYGRGMGDANSVMYKDGLLHGVKDPRGDGQAVGY